MNYRYNLVIGTLIFITNLLGTLFGYATVNLGFISGDGPMMLCIIPFCVSFFLLDVYTNQYGLDYSKKLIKLIMIVRLILALCIFLLLEFNLINHQYYNYINPVYTGLYAGAIASMIAFNLNCYIFATIYNFFDGKFIWLRCLIATSIGELIYSLISNTIFLIQHDTIRNIWEITLHNYSFKVFFELSTLPFTYLLISFLNLHEKPYSIKFINFEMK